MSHSQGNRPSPGSVYREHYRAEQSGGGEYLDCPAALGLERRIPEAKNAGTKGPACLALQGGRGEKGTRTEPLRGDSLLFV